MFFEEGIIINRQVCYILVGLFVEFVVVENKIVQNGNIFYLKVQAEGESPIICLLV